MSGDKLLCPLCRRRYLVRDSLLDHLVEDHDPRAVAEDFLALVCPVKCGKKCYPDRIAAETALLDTWRRNKSPRRHECRAYHCEQCNAWHLTSKSERAVARLAPVEES